MYVYCAYCGKQIDTDRQKYYSPSIWSGDTNYYCDMYNCYSKYRDKLQKERFEAQLKSGTQKSSGATYIPAQFTGYKEQKFTDGSRYVGEFVDGKRHGKGTNYFADGTRYDGDWKNGYMNGYGVCVYADGEKYEGEWADGKRHGQGTCFYASGAKYVGKWVNNKKQGKGIYYYVNPTATYDGDWYDNVRHGYGVEEIHAQGGTQRYEGEWKDNKRCGKGKIRYIDGEVKEGYFENGKFVGTAAPTSQVDGGEMDISPEMLARFMQGGNIPQPQAASASRPQPEREIWLKLLPLTSEQRNDFLATHPDITVPSGVDKIPDNMFKDCINLRSIRFNQDLREIGIWAFKGCKNLGPDLVIPSSVERIRRYAFSNCHSIRKAVIPNHITLEEASLMCSVTVVEFETNPPIGVVLEKGAFRYCNMTMSKEMQKKIKDLNSKAFK